MRQNNNKLMEKVITKTINNTSKQKLQFINDAKNSYFLFTANRKKEKN